MANPIFRWLLEAIIPRNLAGLDLFRAAPCAYAGDFAVAVSSLGRLMTAPTLAFKVVDPIAGLNLHAFGCKTAVKVANLFGCEQFRKMKMVRYAKHVGTTIGPEGHIHRWTTFRMKFIQRIFKNKRIIQKPCKKIVQNYKTMPSRFGIILDPYPQRVTLKDEHMPYNALLEERVMPLSPAYYAWLRVWPWTRLAWDLRTQPRGWL